MYASIHGRPHVRICILTHAHQDLAILSRRLMSAKPMCFQRRSSQWWSQLWKTFWNKTSIGSLLYCLGSRYGWYRTVEGGKKRGVCWGILTKSCTRCFFYKGYTNELCMISFSLDTSVCAADSPGPAGSRIWCPCAGWRSVFTIPSGQVVCTGGKGQSSIV